MADLVLNWGLLGAFGTNVEPTQTVDTGGINVTIGFDAQDEEASGVGLLGKSHLVEAGRGARDVEVGKVRATEGAAGDARGAKTCIWNTTRTPTRCLPTFFIRAPWKPNSHPDHYCLLWGEHGKCGLSNLDADISQRKVQA